MLTYLILNLVFVSTLSFCAHYYRRIHKRSLLLAVGSVTLLTLLFDPILIALDFFSYNPDLIIGWHLFGAPIEDFFYPVYAVIIVACLWEAQSNEVNRA